MNKNTNKSVIKRENIRKNIILIIVVIVLMLFGSITYIMCRNNGPLVERIRSILLAEEERRSYTNIL